MQFLEDVKQAVHAANSVHGKMDSGADDLNR